MSRELNIDLLRVVATMMVIILHSFAIYIVTNYDYYNYDLMLSTSIAVFTRVAVPLFVMVSGRYLIDCLSKMSIKEFYFKRAKRIMYPLLFWSIVYSIYKILFVEGTTLQSNITDFIMGVPYIHLWFLYMILGLYLITPILYGLKKRLSPKSYILFSIVSLLVAPIFELTVNIQFFQFFTYLGFFTMGDILKDYVVERRTRLLSLLGYFFCMFIAVGFTVYFLSLKSDTAFNFSGSTMYTTTIGTICLYVFFNGLVSKESVLSKISMYSMGIYCIHHLILDLLANYTDETITGIMVIDAGFYAIATFVMSFALIHYFSKAKYVAKWIGL